MGRDLSDKQASIVRRIVGKINPNDAELFEAYAPNVGSGPKDLLDAEHGREIMNEIGAALENYDPDDPWPTLQNIKDILP